MDKDNKLAVLVSCFDWYEKRLIYIDNYLKKKGYSVLILTSDYSHVKKKKNTHLSSVANVKYIEVPEYRRNISGKRLYSHYIFAKRVEECIKKELPVLVYSLIPPNYLLHILKKQKEIIRYKLIVDIIDLWPESFPYGKRDIFPFCYWRNLRNKNLAYVDLAVVECDLYRKQIDKYIDAKKIHTLYLIEKPLEFGLMTDKDTVSNNKIVLGYLGSINSLIDITRICQVVSILQKVNPVKVEIVGCGEKSNELISTLKKFNCEVNYYGAVFDEKEKYRIFKKCNFGINIYKNNVQIGLTIKSIDYFKYGLPVLNTIQGDTQSIIDKYSAGININELSESEFIEKIQQTTFSREKIKQMFDELFNEEGIYKRLEFIDEVIK